MFFGQAASQPAFDSHPAFFCAATYPPNPLSPDKAAIDKLSAGDVITIFTPDPTHYDIAKYAIERKIHVLVTKPAVMTLDHHRELVDLAKKHKVLVMVEFHKVRSARRRARHLKPFHLRTAPGRPFPRTALTALPSLQRWDPIYTDARARARTLGDFSYFYSIMTQPKFQLEVRLLCAVRHARLRRPRLRITTHRLLPPLLCPDVQGLGGQELRH